MPCYHSGFMHEKRSRDGRRRWDDGPLTNSTPPELVLKASPEEKRSKLKCTLKVCFGFIFSSPYNSNPTGVDSTALWSKLITCCIYCLFTPVASDVHACLDGLE